MFLIVAKQMVLMFLLIMVGFVIRRTKLADEAGNRVLSNVLLMVIVPFVVLNSLLTVEYNARLLRGFFWSMVFAVLTHLIGIIVAHFLVTGNDKDTMIERYSAVYSNCGFMGIPLVQAILGAEGVFYITAYIIIFNLLTWTHGMLIISGDTSLHQLIRGLLSPTVCAIVIGFIGFFLRVKLPSPVEGAIGYMAGMNTPMGMIVAGVALAESNPIAALKRRRVYLVSVLKLFVMPLLIMVIMLIFRPSEGVYYTTIAAAASPAGTTATMLALRYDSDYRYASELYVITTLLSMITIPVVIAIAELFL